MLRRILLALALIVPAHALAQLDEVVVTARKQQGEPIPGVFLKRPGDYLLLEVEVANDTRGEADRENEIYRTLKNAIDTAKKEKGIELSVVEDDFVLPLTTSNYEVKLRAGNRPDTSIASIKVKTPVPSDIGQASAAIERLRGFVKKIPVAGRTELTAVGSVDLSVVDPHQYRAELVSLIAADIKDVTSSLGPEYKVVLNGIDAPVAWVRSGPLHLLFFVPYSYQVVPSTITSVDFFNDY